MTSNFKVDVYTTFRLAIEKYPPRQFSFSLRSRVKMGAFGKNDIYRREFIF